MLVFRTAQSYMYLHDIASIAQAPEAQADELVPLSNSRDASNMI